MEYVWNGIELKRVTVRKSIGRHGPFDLGGETIEVLAEPPTWDGTVGPWRFEIVSQSDGSWCGFIIGPSGGRNTPSAQKSPWLALSVAADWWRDRVGLLPLEAVEPSEELKAEA